MIKKTVLITNLVILSCSSAHAEYFIEELQRVREQEPDQQQEMVQEQEVVPAQQEVLHEEVLSAASQAQDEPTFDNFDEPEVELEIVEAPKPSALLKFLAKGYPIFAWCVSVKKSMVARWIVFKNNVKNWFGLHRSDQHQ